MSVRRPRGFEKKKPVAKSGGRRASAIADAIVETLHNPLLILEPDLRVKRANAIFYTMFRVSFNDTEGRFLYDLGDGQWNIPRLRQLLEEILPRNSAFNDLVVEQEFPCIGKKMR